MVITYLYGQIMRIIFQSADKYETKIKYCKKYISVCCNSWLKKFLKVTLNLLIKMEVEHFFFC